MPDTWELASAFARFLLYFGVLGSTGLVLVRIVFRRETGGLHGPMVRQATMLAVLALLASGIGFALKGAAMTGEASGMTDPEMLGLVWQTPAGTALVLRVAGLALILVGLRSPVSASRSPPAAVSSRSGRFPGSGMSLMPSRSGSNSCCCCTSRAPPSGSASCRPSG